MSISDAIFDLWSDDKNSGTLWYCILGSTEGHLDELTHTTVIQLLHYLLLYDLYNARKAMLNLNHGIKHAHIEPIN